jgi:hypothetical protein
MEKDLIQPEFELYFIDNFLHSGVAVVGSLPPTIEVPTH